MKKEELISSLEQYENDLKQLEKTITRYAGAQIKQKPTKDAIQAVARKWFETIEKPLAGYSVPDDNIEKYHKYFDDLMLMALVDTRKVRYTDLLKLLRESFRKDLIVPVYKHTGDIGKFEQLDAIIESLSEEEKPLMQEALDCAKHGFYRASVVLGWASVVYRMHHIVEKMGFDNFNKKSEDMNKIQDGRYKRYSKVFHVHNAAELQATVFDNDLLWVLEYAGIIDYNQHERLSMCYVMRSTSAHPSSTKVTPENVTSFYSDLKTIIFDNSKFKMLGTPSKGSQANSPNGQ
jgi:hypothetical protein